MPAEPRDVLGRILIANDGEVLSRLRLSAAEAARVCNVTPRQLIYWTKKGLVKASADGPDGATPGVGRAEPGSYDVYAMEKVIRIRQALAKGYSLEKAAQLVQREISSLQSEVKRLDDMQPEDLEDELRRRLERLEERVGQLRRSLPVALSLARLRRATAELARLEEEGALHAAGATGEGAKALVLRLGRAVDELEMLLREVGSSTV
ncbi:MAG TPA: MerR family transcriptional regulator [Candidatus Limnocylindria bacterium]|nr:MerR family transcriptional regulator [Candidatus Limnocylindria bacterium]